MKIMITGDRDWTDKEAIRDMLKMFKVTEVIEGEARGADSLAREAAEELGLLVHKFPADWEQYKKAAGPIRNREMLKQQPELIMAFHDDLRHSRGTKDACMAALTRYPDIPILHFRHVENGSLGMKVLAEKDL